MWHSRPIFLLEFTILWSECVVNFSWAKLSENPEQLDRARQRFSRSPPYRSRPSELTTVSESPNLPDEEQRNSTRRETLLMLEHEASRPYQQFRAQQQDEYSLLFQPPPGDGCVADMTAMRFASEVVKKQWVKQHIWKDEWNGITTESHVPPFAQWKHEEPLTLESESETDVEAEKPVRLIFAPEKNLPRRKSRQEIREMKARRSIRGREHEASRSLNQFIYRVSEKREHICEQSRPSGSTTLDLDEINAKSYEHVKALWVKKGIWNRKWGILPGHS